MIRLFYWIIFIMFFLITSCKKEEKLLPEHFIGTWDWQYTFAYHYNEQGQVFKIDTLRPNSGVWGIDFDCHFEVKENGDIKFFKDNGLFLKLKSRQLEYGYDANPDVRVYLMNSNIFRDRGEYQRISLRGNVLSEYLGCHGFPIDGGGDLGNEVSIIRKNGNVAVYNVFKRR